MLDTTEVSYEYVYRYCIPRYQSQSVSQNKRNMHHHCTVYWLYNVVCEPWHEKLHRTCCFSFQKPHQKRNIICFLTLALPNVFNYIQFPNLCPMTASSRSIFSWVVHLYPWCLQAWMTLQVASCLKEGTWIWLEWIRKNDWTRSGNGHCHCPCLDSREENWAAPFWVCHPCHWGP